MKFEFIPFFIQYAKKRIHYRRPALMGIINVTPDSFYDGKEGVDIDQHLKKIEQLIKEGADIIDIGGESTRPGSKPVSEKEEMKRVIPVIEAAKKFFPQSIFSIDTVKCEVADACLELGVDMINDVSAGEHSNNEILSLAVKHQTPIVLMHKQGMPKDMQDSPIYKNPVEEIKFYLNNKVKLLLKLGLSDDKIILDPGIGFGKNKSHNLEILRHAGRFGEFRELGVSLSKDIYSKRFPVLIGASMKTIVGDMTGEQVANRLPGTLGLHLGALMRGASIFRVHHVKAMRDAINTCMEVINV